MRLSGTLKLKHFTPFLSAAEEAAAWAEEAWANEGAHMLVMSGYVVETPHAAEPYNVMFDHGDGPATEQSCSTICECQALIRRTTAIPPYNRAFDGVCAL